MSFENLQISQEERQYYQQVHGFDPVTDKIPINDSYLTYRYEVWFPLVQDPTLNATGVEIGARVDLDCEEFTHNHIVFRYKGKEAMVECTHTVVYSGSAQDMPELAKDAHLGHDIALKRVSLPPWGHFAALKSYVAGIAEIGLSRLIRSSLEAEQVSDVSFGFNSIMRRQILAALKSIAPGPSLKLSSEFFMELVDDSPADWLLSRAELLATLIPLENGLIYIENYAPGWSESNEEKLEPFKRLLLVLKIFSSKLRPQELQ